ncbi:MAG: AAA family ATPase [Bacillus sp. (in: Bacteria)]|nr:AAA family ATPase [Bacillus sp. (in: firmicutes)]
MTKQTKERQQEQNYVRFVVNEINRRINAIAENVGSLKEGVIQIRKTFWEDVTVNLDDAHEVGETFTSIKQQAEMLSERERTHQHFHKQLKNLERLKDTPFFGRIDFLETGENEGEKVYIGTASLMDEKDEEFLVYDWRAPISSLYYNYSPGPAQYEVPSEVIEGEVQLKRQYIIKNGQLKSMFDTGVTIGDELLQEVLSNTANTQMKSIVATIQKEQNQIIRNEKSKYLLVQGVAGSGKTSAALQRVAYLLYRYRGKIDSDNIMLFSPNYLFNSYVATVLPELGEENMKQSTYQEYLQYRLEKQFELDDPFSQLEYVYTAKGEPDYEARMKAIAYKASLDYKKLIDQYVNHLSEGGLQFKDLLSRGELVFSVDEIHDYFYELDKGIPIPNRIHLTAEWLLKRLAAIEQEERTKDWVLEESELLDKEDFLESFRAVQEDNDAEDSFDDFEKEQDLLAKKVVRRRFQPVRKRIKRLKFLDVKGLYRNLFASSIGEELTENPVEAWGAMADLTVTALENNQMLYEDATPYLYLTDQLEGRKTNTLIRHLFLDEAQDYSPFQLAFLQQLFPNSKMTILGDLNQGIYAHSRETPTLLAENLYDPTETEVLQLKKSYRSTKEIVQFTKEFIEGGELIEPFNRQGDLPVVTVVDEEDVLQERVIQVVKEMVSRGRETVAILCKTEEEARNVFTAMKERLDVHLMTKDSYTFKKGILVMPAYVAKGIEFDGVAVYNASAELYGGEEDRNLFYTACTRAMHELHVFSLGAVCPFIRDASKDTFELRDVADTKS